MSRIVDDQVHGRQVRGGAFLTESFNTNQRLREDRPAGEDIRANTLERAVQSGAGLQPHLSKFGAANRKTVRNVSGERREILQPIIRGGAGALD